MVVKWDGLIKVILVIVFQILIVNPLDAGSRLTDFAQSSNAAGSLLTDCTVYERSGW